MLRTFVPIQHFNVPNSTYIWDVTKRQCDANYRDLSRGKSWNVLLLCRILCAGAIRALFII